MIRTLAPVLACAVALAALPAEAAAPDNLPSALSELKNQYIRQAILDSARRLTAAGRAAVGQAISACQLPGDAADLIATGKFDDAGLSSACRRAYDAAQPLSVSSGAGEFFSYVTLEKNTADHAGGPGMQLMLTSSAIDQATQALVRDALAQQRSYADELQKLLAESGR